MEKRTLITNRYIPIQTLIYKWAHNSIHSGQINFKFSKNTNDMFAMKLHLFYFQFFKFLFYTK